MNNKLTPAEISHFKQDGYLVRHQSTFDADKFARLKQHAEDLFARAAAGGKVPALIDCPHWGDPALFEWISAPEMLGMIEPILGPDIGVFACHLLQKPATVGKRVPWHEDSAYWGTVLAPMTVASVTVALEPSVPANGCLRVIPGTHHHGYSDYTPLANPNEQLFSSEVKAGQYDESKAVDIELQPNEASIHDGRIIHGSNPNQGTLRRAVFTARYFPATSKFQPETNQFFKRGFHIYLVRGQDRAGNKYSDPTKCYEANPVAKTM